MDRAAIREISARQVYSDRMKPAISVTVVTECGITAKSICSPGISVGTHEAAPLYDGGSRFRGQGVTAAVEQINRVIAPCLVGHSVLRQAENDGILLELGKEKMGANSLTAVSTALLYAGAAVLDIPLYEYIGGTRAFTMPVPAALVATGSNRYGFEKGIGYKPTYSMLAYGFETYQEASEALWETYMNWYDLMKERLAIKMQPIAGMAIPAGKVENDFRLWEMMAETIDRSGYHGRIGLQADLAANCFYHKESGTYQGLFSAGEKSRAELMDCVRKMAKEYPFVSVEDPLMEDDFEGFAQLTKETGIQIIGDDLIATNKERLKMAVEADACNCIRISAAQIGTFSEAAETALYAAEHDIGISVCGERGEGLAACDYAVGLNAGTAREYGMCYSGNRLMEIGNRIGARARFFGADGIKGDAVSKRKTMEVSV